MKVIEALVVVVTVAVVLRSAATGGTEPARLTQYMRFGLASVPMA